jgi:hypothetical protein
MRHHGHRLAVALLIVLALAFPTSAIGHKPAATTPPTTTVVKVEPVQIKDQRPPVDETSLLDAAIAGVTAIAGVMVGARYTKKSEQDRMSREERNDEIAEIAKLVDRVSAVTDRLAAFGTGTAKPEDVVTLSADVRAVLDARDRVRDPEIRGSVESFAAAAQEVVQDPKPGPVLTAQVKATASTADVVKARAKQAIETLRSANMPSKKTRRAAA